MQHHRAQYVPARYFVCMGLLQTKGVIGSIIVLLSPFFYVKKQAPISGGCIFIGSIL
jgi:hypothetical protein